MGSGCCSVGRAVAADTRGPRFESSHRETFVESFCLMSIVLKRRNKRKRGPNGAFKKQWPYLPRSRTCVISRNDYNSRSANSVVNGNWRLRRNGGERFTLKFTAMAHISFLPEGSRRRLGLAFETSSVKQNEIASPWKQIPLRSSSSSSWDAKSQIRILNEILRRASILQLWRTVNYTEPCIVLNHVLHWAVNLTEPCVELNCVFTELRITLSRELDWTVYFTEPRIALNCLLHCPMYCTELCIHWTIN